MRCTYLVLVTLSIVCCVTSVALYHGKRDVAMNNSQIASVFARATAKRDHGEPLKSIAGRHEHYINNIVKKEIRVPDNLLPDKTDDKMRPDNITSADENEKKTSTNEKFQSDENLLRYDIFMDTAKAQNLNDGFLDDYERKRDFGPFITNNPDTVGDDMEKPIDSVQSNGPLSTLAQNTEKIVQLAQALIQNSNFMENRPDQSNRYRNKNLFLVDGKELDMDDRFQMPASYDERKQQQQQEREKLKQLQDFKDQELEQLKGFREGQPQAPAAVEPVDAVEQMEVENQAAPVPSYIEPMASIIKFANMLLHKVGVPKEKYNSRKQRTNDAYNPNMGYVAGPNSVDYSDMDIGPVAPAPLLPPFPLGIPNIATSADVAILESQPIKPIFPMPKNYKFLMPDRDFKDQTDDIELRCPVHREAKKKSNYYDAENEDEQPIRDNGGGGLVCSCRFIKNRKRGERVEVP